jgi:hypothetical protein
MARLWQSGFELNTLGALGVEFTVVHGSPTIVTTPVLSGTYALRISSLVSTAFQGVRYTFFTVDSNGPLFFRCYFRYATLPTADNTIIVIETLGAVRLIFVELDSTGALKLNDEDGQIGSASSALSANIWYRVEIKYDRTPAAGSHVVRARVDGNEFAGSATRNLSSGVGRYRVGGNESNEAQTIGLWYFDDLVINDNTGSFQNSYPGAGEIVHLKPNAAGDASDWTNNYLSVDEVAPDDATTFVASNTLNHIDDHNMDDSPADVITVNVVCVGVRFNGAGASANASFVARIKASAAGTVEESTAIVPANTTWNTNTIVPPRNYPLVLYDLPGASTTVWTKADLDALQGGYRLSATNTNNAQVSTLWISVDLNENISATHLISYCSANMPESDTTTSGGVIDPDIRVIFTQLATSGILEMLSSNAGDTTQNVTVTGRDATGVIFADTKTLNGTTVVDFTGTFERVLKVVMDADAAGTITIRRDGAGATIGTIPPGERGFRLLFYDSASATTGQTKRYEKTFFKNTHNILTLINAKVQLSADPSAVIRQGIVAAKNDSTSVANRLTDPTVTYVDDGVDQSVPSAMLEAGSGIGVWYELTLAQDEAPLRSTFVSRCSGTTGL